jgi:hypothetical protein
MKQIRGALLLAAIVAALAFLSSLFARAADAAPIVRICQQECRDGRCYQNWTSGTVIGRCKDKLAILTCAHGTQKGTHQVEIEQGEGWEEGELAGIDSVHDLKLLLVDHAATTGCCPLGSVDPPIGQKLITGGFARGRTLRCRDTIVKGYFGDELVGSETYTDGESGGAALLGTKLVGVIHGDFGPTSAIPGNRKPSSLINDGALCSLAPIRRFVKGKLGMIPGEADSSDPKAATPKDKQPAAEGGPAEATKTETVGADEFRNAIVDQLKGEVAKLLQEHGTQLKGDVAALLKDHGGDLKDAISASAASGKLDVGALPEEIKAEVAKLLAGHGDDLKQAIAKSAAEGKLDPAAFAPVLQSVAKSAATDVAGQVTKEAIPSILSAIGVHLGGGALAGSVGGPAGAIAGAAIGLVGFFINRTVKKSLANRPPSGPTPPWTIPSGGNVSSSPQLAPAPVAAINDQPAQRAQIVVMPPAAAQSDTKYVPVPVADSLTDDLNSALDAEVALRPEFAAVVARARNSAGIIHRSRKAVTPSAPFVNS